MQTVDMNYI